MFTVYAIISEIAKKIYIGQTVDLSKRLKQHNSENDEHFGQFTKQNKGPWRLVYKEKFETRLEAIKKERQLKSFRGREFIKNLIKNTAHSSIGRADPS